MNRGHEARQPEKAQGKEFGMRLGVVALLFAMFLSFIVFRLLNIQVMDVQKYRERASRQYEREVVETAKRGVIYDRAGNRLAESVLKVSFFADPQFIREEGSPSEVAAVFSRYFGKGRGEYLRKLRRKGRFVWMERSVPIAKAKELMESAPTGVGFRKEQQRYYLNLAAQVIGLTDRDNKGVSGLERKYHEELKGLDGIKVYQRSATGQRFLAASEQQIDAKEGLGIRLTLDADVQAVMEDELQKAVREFDAEAATGVVMDVKTGEILAMANFPTFDMNNRRDYKARKARNRAITDAFEPGSTFKIVMASAATEVLGREAEDSLDAHNGVFVVHRRVIRDHEKFERMTFRDAMVHSSNIVAAKTAMEIGEKTFYDYITRFGFGQKTGVGLIGEIGGLLASPDEWDRTTLPWLGYGYAFTATPLQVLQAYAAIANDGVMMRPYIVSGLVDSEGRTVREFGPEKVRQVVRPETAAYVRNEYLGPIVERGTGTAAAVREVRVAGKTGTAQKLKNGSYQQERAYVSSFVGFFPVENPKIAAIVVVDEPKKAYYASTVAAPVFSRVCSRMIACSEPLKESLAMKAPGAAELDTLRNVAVPDLAGLDGRDAKKLLRWSGLDMDYKGRLKGVVAGQAVACGTMVREGTSIRVSLQDGKPETQAR